MPKEYPEYWKEKKREEETDDDEAVYNPIPLNNDMIVDTSEKDLLNDSGTNREDMDIGTSDKHLSELDEELERLKERKLDRELEKEKKDIIKQKKSEIRHLKYEPVYEAGEKIKGAGVKLGKTLDKARGSKAQRKVRKQKIKNKVKKLSNMAKKKGVSFGKSMHEKKQSGSSGMFGGMMGSGFFRGNDKSGYNRLAGGGLDSPSLLNQDISKRLVNLNSNKLMGSNKLLGNKQGMGLFGSSFSMGSSKLLSNDFFGNKKKGKKKMNKSGLKLMNERIKI